MPATIRFVQKHPGAAAVRLEADLARTGKEVEKMKIDQPGAQNGKCCLFDLSRCYSGVTVFPDVKGDGPAFEFTGYYAHENERSE